MAALTLFRPFSGCLLLAAIAMSLLTTRPAAAQDGAADQRIAFDIPAQSLDSALARYFQLTGVQLLYDSALTTGRRSSAVRGNHAPREALRLLLRGTGLVARYSRTSAAIITTPDKAAETPLVPLGRLVVRERIVAPRLTKIQRMEYYGRLEDELQAHLHNDRRTERLTFNVIVSMRVSDTGELIELRVDQGTSDGRTDRLLSEVLTGRKVSRPPEGIVQPLLVSLRGKRRSGN